MNLNKMTLRIWTPDRLILDERVDKILAEAVNGFFCLLPRHIDYLAGLVPGILSYSNENQERYVAVDRGILVKCGFKVQVSVRRAITGENLEELELEVSEKFQMIDQREEELSTAMNQLEADFIRRFAEINKQRE